MKLSETLRKAQTCVVSKASHLSKKDKIIFSCLIAGTLGLMLTNPNKAAYTEYAATWLPEQVKKECDRVHENLEITPPFARMPAQDACKSFVSGAGKVLNPVLKGVTNMSTDDRTNLLLCSVYTTRIGNFKTFRTIGIGGQFIRLPGE